MDLVCICLHFKSWVCWRQEGLQLSNKYAKNMGKNEEKHKYFSANFDTARKSEFGSLIRHCSLYRIEKKRLVFSRLFEVVLFLQKFSFSFCKKNLKKKSLWNFQNPKPPMIRHYNYYTWIGNDLYKWMLLIFILLASSRMRTFLPSMTSFLCWWNRTRFFAPMMVMWLFLVVIMIIRWSN